MSSESDKIQAVLERLQRANTMMEGLIDSAMEGDNKLSEDEKKLLFGINSNLETYAKTIMESISDGKVEISELDRLKEIEKKIVDDAEEIIKSDGVITDEERKLVERLIETIYQIGKL